MKDFNITNVRFLRVNYDPQVDGHVVTLRYFNNILDEATLLRLNDDSNDRFLQTRVGNTAYNLQMYIKTQIVDITRRKTLNSGGYALQNWLINCNDRNRAGQVQNFNKCTKSSSPIPDSGAIVIPPIGDKFLYIETSCNNNFGLNAFCAFERTDISHISKITF